MQLSAGNTSLWENTPLGQSDHSLHQARLAWEFRANHFPELAVMAAGVHNVVTYDPCNESYFLVGYVAKIYSNVV